MSCQIASLIDALVKVCSIMLIDHIVSVSSILFGYYYKSKKTNILVYSGGSTYPCKVSVIPSLYFEGKMHPMIFRLSYIMP